MTTKDYVYLGLILLAALAFYCNGFYAGVYRCKKMYEALEDETDFDSETAPPTPESVNSVDTHGNTVAFPVLPRGSISLVQGRNLRGDFSNN
jgi:hypothetical protein